MKFANLLHNPAAGEGEYTKGKLKALVEASGFKCSYSSTKKMHRENPEAAAVDFIILAGGDGTVRKVVENLMDTNLPIGLIPLGTANNIAKTLGIKGDPKEIIEGWNNGSIKKYDVGRIYGLKKAGFFLEAFGYGMFPRLMKAMKKKKDLPDAPEKLLQMALETLHDIILSTKARFCKIEIDGSDHSGKFLLAEVMNTRSVGPNLNLAPFADPGDGLLEVILISERQREEFASYVLNKINGKEQPPMFNVLKAKNLEIYWHGKLLHVDDRIVELKEPMDIRIKLQEGVLHFLIPVYPAEKKH